MSDEANEGKDAETSEAAIPPSPVEWVARGLSLLLMAALVGYVAWLGVGAPAEADVRVTPRLDEVRAVDASWALPVDVENLGGRSLIDLGLSVALVDDSGATLESSDLQVPLIAHDERLRAELWFSRDPREHEVEVDIGGYRLP